MTIHKILVGGLKANCYVVFDETTKEAIVVDPGGGEEEIIDFIDDNKLKVKGIIITHHHFDHIGAVEKLKWRLRLEELILKEGDEIKIGSEVLKIIETPGHSKDSICIVGPDYIFTGDTLFKQGIGRTDLEDGSEEQIKESLVHLMQYPDNFEIYPGHGSESTIGEEKQFNHFLSP